MLPFFLVRHLTLLLLLIIILIIILITNTIFTIIPTTTHVPSPHVICRDSDHLKTVID